MLTAVYTEQAAEALGPAGDGLHAIAEFEPFTGAGEGVAEWRALMERAGVPLNSFAEGGYVAASAFVEALRAIRGEVTRASVTQALRDLGEHRSPLMGTPYAFAEAPAHNPNRAVKVVRLQDGAWETVSQDWLRPDVASDWLAAGAR
jgi:branched-chain amino acid transport system substrate-binding protein